MITMTVRITNIQHFCLHDGPGIRTTIFLKGCNLTCPWCANPENMSYNIETYDENKTFGYDITLNELKNEILKDKTFYSLNNGGVTFSGGEPLLQIKKLEPLLKDLKKENINICFETALHVPKENIKIMLKYANELFVDIKILTPTECEKILNGNINLYLNNMDFLLKNNKNVTFRIPLIEEYTIKKENIKLILDLLKKYPKQKVEIFKIHNLAEKKYSKLNKKIPKFKEISDDKINNIFNEINKIVENCEIIKI